MAINKEDLKSIQADVASFVSSLGFSTPSVDGDGFYDADFRKKGRISDKKPERATQKNSFSEKPSSPSELNQSNKKSKTLKNITITSELHQSPMKSDGKLDKTSLKQTSSKQEQSKFTEKPKFQEKKGSGELDMDDSKKSKKKKKKKEEEEEEDKDKEEKAEKFSTEKKERGDKARASKSHSTKEKQKAEKKSMVFGGADSKKKQKTENTETDTFASAKKQKAQRGQGSAEKDQKLIANLESARDGSKTLSKIWSLLKSEPWFKASSSLNASNGALTREDKKVGRLGNDTEWSALVATARRKGEELMERAAAEYEKSRGKDNDMRWLMIARKTGTTADKVAAFTVLLQDNAIANLKSLDALLGMVTSKGGKRHAAMGIDALKELFVASLLPDRKLKYLTQQPLQAQPDTREAEELLFLWYWEDCLKQRYEQFVGSLEEATKDNLPFLKEKAVKTLYELLKSKPEQERKLLSALVNKLGDPERKIASNAGYYMSCLLSAHPNMKMVVVQEVDFFLFRPHLGLRSRYQAVVFLNQIVLSNKGDGPKLAKRLIDIYFSLFKVITAGGPRNNQKKGRSNGTEQINKKKNEDEGDAVVEIDSRLLSALLTGVNRAFPYVAADDVDILIEEHTPALFRLVHSKSFNVGVQALILLYQLLAKNNAVSDRLYRALYAVLLSPGLSKSSKMEMFLGLVFKAIKSDINSKRMAAFSKRLMQVALQGAPQFACGCLLLLSEILKSRPTLWHAVTQPEDADEETEHFEDFKEEEDTTKDDTARPDQLASSAIQTSSETIGNKEVAIEPAGWPKEGQYNPRHRDPFFCNADQACWWELTALASHTHPSVAAMAKTLLSGASILYAGDPLRDLAFSVFLDRFTEKKPKSRRKSETWHGSSLSAPARKASLMTTLPIGDEFLKLSEKEVAPEDVVFHKFYTSKVERKQKSRKVEKSKDDAVSITGDDDLLGDNSDDDEIEDLLDQDEGMEMGLDDLSEDENESEGEWTYLQPDGGFEDANGEHNSSDAEDVDFEDMNGVSSDEEILSVDLNEHTFEEDMDEEKESQLTFNPDAKKHPKKRLTSNKREKKRKEKSAFNKEGSSKSPFAALDEYSHLFDDGRLEKDKIDVASSTRKRKRAK